MRKISLTLCLALALLAAPAVYPPQVMIARAEGRPATRAKAGIKGEKTYPPFKAIVLKAADVTSAKASFLWDVDGECDFIESGDTLYAWCPPGTYTVRLTAIDFAAQKVERAKFTFTVSGTPPGPGPGPQPPFPDDPLVKSLRDAYAAETASNKATQFAFYRAVYASAATLVDASATANDLFTRMSAALHVEGVGIPRGSLPKISAVVGGILNTELGTDPSAALDKAKAKASLAKIASALAVVQIQRK